MRPIHKKKSKLSVLALKSFQKLPARYVKNIKLEYKDFMGSHNGYFIKRRHSQSDSLLKIIQEIEQTEIDFDEYSHVKIF